MNAFARFSSYKMQNVETACVTAVQEALSCGMTADELRAVMADCWRDELTERAARGQRAIAGDLMR